MGKLTLFPTRALCRSSFSLPRSPRQFVRVQRESTLSASPVSALLSAYPGATLKVTGFVRTVRKQKRFAFAAIDDGSTLQTLQVVLTPEQADGLSTGTAVAITGQWNMSPAGKEQTHELHAEEVRLLGQNDAAAYPIQKKYHTPEFLRTLPHLRSRLPFNALLLRLRSQVIARLTTFFAAHSFIQTHPPIITSSDCEGAGEVFAVTAGEPPSHSREKGSLAKDEASFFGSPKYLTVSTQLHLEALAQSVGRVWTLSPTFRAEKSDTARHLSEFYMLEAEVAFVEDVSQIMDLVEDMLRTVAVDLQTSQVGQELLLAKAETHEEDSESAVVSQASLASRWQSLANGPWPRITYERAIQHLQEAVSQGKASFAFAPTYEAGLQTEHEKYLADTIGRRGPIFVTHYPREQKPFYMAPSAHEVHDMESAPTVACFDLLVPEICELVGGSMREHRHSDLLKSMEDHGIAQSNSTDSRYAETDTSLQWYLDLRRYGSVPHGGFGLGFDRLLCYLSGASNIREVVSFPRWYGRCDC